MKKTIILFGLLLILFANNSFASTWCQWVDPEPANCRTATILPSGTEVITTAEGARISGDDANKWDTGYYKLQRNSPPLQANEVYSGWAYSFATNIITATREVVSNYSNLTLTEAKWDKYWDIMNKYVLPVRENDCTYSGFIIPKTARELMVDSIGTGKTMTYEVYNEATGIPSGFQRTATQAAAVLDFCLDAIETVNTKMYVDDGTGSGISAKIMSCADKDCINAINW